MAGKTAVSASAVMAACIVVLAVCAAAGAPAAMAQSCTTNSGSPTQGDANSCVQFVRNRGSNQCCQQNGSGCTNMAFAGTAAVDICGPQGSCVSCATAGNSLNTILANCVANVGGTALVAGTIASGVNTVQIRRA